MPTPIEPRELEALVGRPAAFTGFVRPLIDARVATTGTGYALARWGTVLSAPREATVWWIWPWSPDDPRERLDSAGALARSDFGIPRGWLTGLDHAEPRVAIVVARAPADPQAFHARVTAAMRTWTDRPSLVVEIHGPDALSRWWAEDGDDRVPESMLARRAFAERELDLASCERELVAALDAGVEPGELWAVVADELQRRGDPAGESLALASASASAADQPSRQRGLERAYSEREAARVARAPSHFQRLAYVDARGLSFDVRELEPAGLGGSPMLDGFLVQMWAARVGPFFVRTLAQTDDPGLAGLGLPRALLDAPELRYLSARRHAILGPTGGDVSGQDLSGFRLTPIARAGGPVSAYGARLRGADLRGADLSGWQLDRADLRDATADRDTCLAGTSFVDAVASAELLELVRGWNDRRRARQALRHTGLRRG